MDNIIVTGGAGYIGYSTVEALAKKYPKSKVIFFDNFSKGKLERIGTLLELYSNIVIVPWERADIRDTVNFITILAEYKPTVVVHLAAIVDAFTTNRKGKDLECTIVNHEAAVQIARVSKEHGVRVFVYQSTVSMYSQGFEIDENSPKEPLSVYGRAKYDAEKEILVLADTSFKTCALRSATLVGFNPAFRYETIINLLCVRAVYGVESTLFKSALDSKKSYLHLSDEVHAIQFAIEHSEEMNGQAYNIKSFDTDLNSVVVLIEKEFGVFPYRITDEKKISQQVYTVSSKKIELLGFKVLGNLETTVKETMSGLLSQKNHIRQ